MNAWLILGAGVSGLGAAALLTRRGAFVRVSEKTKLSPAQKKPWLELGVDCCDGGHDLAHLQGISHIVLSPGVPPSHMLVRGAVELGLPLISEIDLALEAYQGHLIAVTGTNGKSTTCAMILHLLKKVGLEAGVGGNFGDPPSAMLARGPLPPYLVLELSSYQLEQSHAVKPEVAVFTSFSHDHIARHGTLEAYLQAKWRVFERQTSHHLALLTPEIQALGKNLGLNIAARTVYVDDPLLKALMPGSSGPKEGHNRLNAAFAVLAVGQVTGLHPESLIPFLKDFHGLPHRCEMVGRIAGLDVINDSKSTNVESTLVALASQAKPVVLFMGGQGKGESYSPVLEKKGLIAALVTFGPTGADIAKELQGHVPIYTYGTLKAALAEISGILETLPYPILFSPGCASFDEFSNYEHRGEVFRKAMIPLCDSSPSRDPSS